MGGYIPLYYSIRNHWVYKDSQYYHVWSEMLFCARYAQKPAIQTYRGEKYTVHRGEFLYSRPSWSKRLGVSERRLRTLIDHMIADNMIERVDQHFRRFTIYKIVNYEKYALHNGQQKRPENSHFEDYYGQQNDQQNRNSRPTADQQTTTKVNRIEGKNDYTGRSPEFMEALDSFAEMRAANHKKLTSRAKQLIVKELDNLAPNNEEHQVRILNQSIKRGWTGVFSIKDQDTDNPVRDYMN